MGRRSGTPRVYFAMAESGPVKIGVSRNIGQRIHNLSLLRKEPVTLLADVLGREFVEHGIHRFLSSASLGKEWFRQSALTMELIAVFCGCLPLEHSSLTPRERAWCMRLQRGPEVQGAYVPGLRIRSHGHALLIRHYERVEMSPDFYARSIGVLGSPFWTWLTGRATPSHRHMAILATATGIPVDAWYMPYTEPSPC